MGYVLLILASHTQVEPPVLNSVLTIAAFVAHACLESPSFPFSVCQCASGLKIVAVYVLAGCACELCAQVTRASYACRFACARACACVRLREPAGLWCTAPARHNPAGLLRLIPLLSCPLAWGENRITGRICDFLPVARGIKQERRVSAWLTLLSLYRAQVLDC